MIDQPASEALAWALVHSTWQCTVAALLVAAVRPARARYAVGCVALFAALGAFMVTFWLYLPEAGSAFGAKPVLPSKFAVAVGQGRLADASQYRGLLVWLTPVWLVGVAFFQLRTFAAWMLTRQLRRRGVCLAPPEWRHRLALLAKRMRVSQAVEFLESPLARMPMVVGFLRPVILVPAGFLSALPPAHVEAILLHELAHIRRHDYLVNVMQTVVEGLLFYHPAIWWISRVIRVEREHCCDDLAVAASESGEAYPYALALTALEAYRPGSGWENAAQVAATGGHFMNRIQRLLYPRQNRATAACGWAVAPAVLTLAVALGVWNSSAAAQPPAQDRQRTAYTIWVNEDVVYIIEPREREAFLRLQTDEERENFIVQFWKRRDPSAGTEENEVKEEHYRRIAYSNDRFRSPKRAGWRTDRGRIYILYGPPDEIEAHPSGRAGGPPSQQWLYNRIQGIGDRVIVEFIDADRNGEYTQTKDPRGR